MLASCFLRGSQLLPASRRDSAQPRLNNWFALHTPNRIVNTKITLCGDTQHANPAKKTREESLVRCGHVLSPEAAAEALLHGGSDEVKRTLQAALDYAKRVEAAAVEGSNPLVFEHLRPDFASLAGSGGDPAAHEDPERAPLLVGRLLAALSYLVNRYAGKVLTQPGAGAFLQPAGSGASESARSTAPMPVQVHGRPDPLHWAEIERVVQ
ncbi:unnamed protein product, partial [Prorocentrum cordatum]